MILAHPAGILAEEAFHRSAYSHGVKELAAEPSCSFVRDRVDGTISIV
jgi:hypothetical protein